jgi:hypothetical protein
MSAANSAAKKRRAPGGSNDTPSLVPGQGGMQQQSQNGQPAGFTFQQVIAIIDKRLSSLEKNVTELAEAREEEEGEGTEEDPVDKIVFTKEMLDEMNAKFEFFADELENLKNTVMTLQTYTLSVNKMLLESNGKFRNIPNIAINK